MDKYWFNSKEADAYLKKVEPFFEKSLENGNYAIYSLDGSALVNYQQLANTTGGLFILKALKNPKADELYEKLVKSRFNLAEGKWDDGGHYYDHNWAWFLSAFYFGRMSI